MGGADPRTELRRALRGIRREEYKAAFVHASIDAALALVAANLVLAVVPQAASALAGSVPVPAPVRNPVANATGLEVARVARSTLAVAAAALFVFLLEFVALARRPVVERFERINPEVREALRTARDAAADERDTRMSRALYADVLDRLTRASSGGLIGTRRLAVTVLLVVVLALATIQVALVDVTIADLPLGGGPEPTDGPGETPAGGEPRPSPGPVPTPPTYEGLQSGEDVLGEAENVTAGSENLSAAVGAGGEGDRPFETGGLSGGTADVDPQRAGFEEHPELADADIIREYNVRIREVVEAAENATTTNGGRP